MQREVIYQHKHKKTENLLVEVVRTPAFGRFGKVETVITKRQFIYDRPITPVWRRLQQEIDILKMLGSHPRIVSYLSHTQSVSSSHPFMVELMMTDGGRDLGEYYDQNLSLGVKGVVNVFQQAVEGLIYIHEKKVLHRDLKPDNLLIDSQKNIRICDFGFAVVLDKDTLPPRSMDGTPDYFAPEVIRRQVQSFPVDVHCMGATIHQILGWEGLVVNLPLDTNRIKSYRKTLSIAFSPKGLKQKKYDRKLSELVLLLREMELSDPEERPATKDLKGRLEKISELVNEPMPGPSKRISKSYEGKRYQPGYKQAEASSRAGKKV
ncbi:protein kinase domain-containing protein [Sansalvadorimonas verongulae]|uniref:protein kinase domain-containing protein n=1 Tax=Sansalvadorimonas verongulae TaxID=2172824 RepID=UPI002E31AD4F|nr:protein kinase [Sansalvadorimonas verongulae]